MQGSSQCGEGRVCRCQLSWHKWCVCTAPSIVRAGRVHVSYRDTSGVEVEFKWDEPSESHGVMRQYKLWMASVVDTQQVTNSDQMTSWSLRLLPPASRSIRLQGLHRGMLYYFTVLSASGCCQ